ncbi:MAG TPA: HNH endonuclease signature motif containing protein [Candidatus Limnocylindrales bacterium]
MSAEATAKVIGLTDGEQREYAAAHLEPLPTRFWSKTARYDCIVWTGAANSKGYGCFLVDGQSQLVHRLAWEEVNGPIPDEMTIDHLCRVRTCVNVDHLELVTIAENNRRKYVAGGLQAGDKCSREHDLTEDNVYRHPRGHIECKTCRRELRAAKKAGKTRQARAQRLLA